jgi:hypothetical protein
MLDHGPRTTSLRSQQHIFPCCDDPYEENSTSESLPLKQRSEMLNVITASRIAPCLKTSTAH